MRDDCEPTGTAKDTGVAGIDDVVDVGPPAAVEDNEEFGFIQSVQMNADRVGVVDPRALSGQLPGPRGHLVAPGHGLGEQPCGLPGRLAVRDGRSGSIEVYDTLHAEIIAYGPGDSE